MHAFVVFYQYDSNTFGHFFWLCPPPALPYSVLLQIWKTFSILTQTFYFSCDSSKEGSRKSAKLPQGLTNTQNRFCVSNLFAKAWNLYDFYITSMIFLWPLHFLWKKLNNNSCGEYLCKRDGGNAIFCCYLEICLRNTIFFSFSCSDLVLIWKIDISRLDIYV